MKVNKFLYFLSFFTILFSCNKKTTVETEETTIAGKLTVWTDPGFKDIIEDEAYVFMAKNSKALITISALPEQIIVQKFFNNEIDMMVMSREFKESEKSLLKSKEITYHSNLFSKDGLVILVNQVSGDSAFTLENLRNILVRKSDGFKNSTIVTDQSNSSNLNSISELFQLDTKVFNIGASGSDSATIRYVENNPKAIGIISFSSISDKDDQATQKLLKKVKFAGIINNDTIFYPSQAEISSGKYPLTRNLYLINKAYKTGLGTGFASFIMSPNGQRIILKKGLVPGIFPERNVEFK